MDYQTLSYFLRFLKSKKITAEDVAKRTVISGGYLSDMKNGRKPVSKEFQSLLRKEFAAEYEEFHKGERPKATKGEELDNLMSEPKAPTYQAAPKTADLMQVLVTLVDKQNGIMDRQNDILQAQKIDLIDRVIRLETNLNAVAGIAESLQYDLVTGRDVVLRSLARIEGLKNEKQLLIEADKMRTSQAVAKDELYKSYEVGIKHKVK